MSEPIDILSPVEEPPVLSPTLLKGLSPVPVVGAALEVVPAIRPLPDLGDLGAVGLTPHVADAYEEPEVPVGLDSQWDSLPREKRADQLYNFRTVEDAFRALPARFRDGISHGFYPTETDSEREEKIARALNIQTFLSRLGKDEYDSDESVAAVISGWPLYKKRLAEAFSGGRPMPEKEFSDKEVWEMGRRMAKEVHRARSVFDEDVAKADDYLFNGKKLSAYVIGSIVEARRLPPALKEQYAEVLTNAMAERGFSLRQQLPLAREVFESLKNQRDDSGSGYSLHPDLMRKLVAIDESEFAQTLFLLGKLMGLNEQEKRGFWDRFGRAFARTSLGITQAPMDFLEVSDFDALERQALAISGGERPLVLEGSGGYFQQFLDDREAKRSNAMSPIGVSAQGLFKIFSNDAPGHRMTDVEMNAFFSDFENARRQFRRGKQIERFATGTFDPVKYKADSFLVGSGLVVAEVLPFLGVSAVGGLAGGLAAGGVGLGAGGATLATAAGGAAAMFPIVQGMETAELYADGHSAGLSLGMGSLSALAQAPFDGLDAILTLSPLKGLATAAKLGIKNSVRAAGLAMLRNGFLEGAAEYPQNLIGLGFKLGAEEITLSDNPKSGIERISGEEISATVNPFSRQNLEMFGGMFILAGVPAALAGGAQGYSQWAEQHMLRDGFYSDGFNEAQATFVLGAETVSERQARYSTVLAEVHKNGLNEEALNSPRAIEARKRINARMAKESAKDGRSQAAKDILIVDRRDEEGGYAVVNVRTEEVYARNIAFESDAKRHRKLAIAQESFEEALEGSRAWGRNRMAVLEGRSKFFEAERWEEARDSSAEDEAAHNRAIADLEKVIADPDVSGATVKIAQSMLEKERARLGEVLELKREAENVLSGFSARSKADALEHKIAGVDYALLQLKRGEGESREDFATRQRKLLDERAAFRGELAPLRRQAAKDAQARLRGDSSAARQAGFAGVRRGISESVSAKELGKKLEKELAEQAGLEPGRVSLDYVRPRGLQGRMVKVLEKALGKRVRFVRVSVDGSSRSKAARELSKSFNGLTSPGTANDIILNADSGAPMLAVLGHELAHNMEVQRPELWGRMREVLLELFGENGRVPGEQMRAIRRRMGGDMLDAGRAAIEREWVSDMFGHRWLDVEFWRELSFLNENGGGARVERLGVIAQFLREVLKFLEKVRRKLRTSLLGGDAVGRLTRAEAVSNGAPAGVLARLDAANLALARILDDYMAKMPEGGYADKVGGEAAEGGTAKGGEGVDFSRSAEAEAVRRQWRNPDGSYKPGWLKAPNGEPTRLSEAEWVGVRTPAFKARYGDWEALAQRRFLDGDPVSVLLGNEFEKVDGQSLIPRVVSWYEEKHGGLASSPVIGEVVLDERGVSDSLSHGLGRAKAAAFAAVPDVIARGVLLDASANYRGQRVSRFTLGAPVRIGGKDFVALVVVQQSKEKQRFYLHEVGLRAALQSGAFESGSKTGAPDGAMKSLLKGIYSVKSESVAVPLDGNGEPADAAVDFSRDSADELAEALEGYEEGKVLSLLERVPLTLEMLDKVSEVFGRMSAGDNRDSLLSLLSVRSGPEWKPEVWVRLLKMSRELDDGPFSRTVSLFVFPKAFSFLRDAVFDSDGLFELYLDFFRSVDWVKVGSRLGGFVWDFVKARGLRVEQALKLFEVFSADGWSGEANMLIFNQGVWDSRFFDGVLSHAVSVGGADGYAFLKSLSNARGVSVEQYSRLAAVWDVGVDVSDSLEFVRLWLGADKSVAWGLVSDSVSEVLFSEKWFPFLLGQRSSFNYRAFLERDARFRAGAHSFFERARHEDFSQAFHSFLLLFPKLVFGDSVIFAKYVDALRSGPDADGISDLEDILFRAFDGSDEQMLELFEAGRMRDGFSKRVWKFFSDSRPFSRELFEHAFGYLSGLSVDSYRNSAASKVIRNGYDISSRDCLRLLALMSADAIGMEETVWHLASHRWGSDELVFGRLLQEPYVRWALSPLSERTDLSRGQARRLLEVAQGAADVNARVIANLMGSGKIEMAALKDVTIAGVNRWRREIFSILKAAGFVGQRNASAGVGNGENGDASGIAAGGSLSSPPEASGNVPQTERIETIETIVVSKGLENETENSVSGNQESAGDKAKQTGHVANDRSLSNIGEQPSPGGLFVSRGPVPTRKISEIVRRLGWPRDKVLSVLRQSVGETAVVAWNARNEVDVAALKAAADVREYHLMGPMVRGGLQALGGKDSAISLWRADVEGLSPEAFEKLSRVQVGSGHPAGFGFVLGSEFNDKGKRAVILTEVQSDVLSVLFDPDKEAAAERLFGDDLDELRRLCRPLLKTFPLAALRNAARRWFEVGVERVYVMTPESQKEILEANPPKSVVDAWAGEKAVRGEGFGARVDLDVNDNSVEAWDFVDRESEAGVALRFSRSADDDYAFPDSYAGVHAAAGVRGPARLVRQFAPGDDGRALPEDLERYGRELLAARAQSAGGVLEGWYRFGFPGAFGPVDCPRWEYFAGELAGSTFTNDENGKTKGNVVAVGSSGGRAAGGADDAGGNSDGAVVRAGDAVRVVAEGERAEAALLPVRLQWLNADGTYKPGWMKGPNGERTRLSEEKWMGVRTEAFKKRYGDWEALWRKYALQNNRAVSVEAGRVRAVEGESGKEAGMRWAKENLQSPVFVPTVVGEVRIDLKSVDRSLGHGVSQAKLDVLPVLADGMRGAVYLGSAPDLGGAALDNHYFAFPIAYEGGRHLVFCRVREDANMSRLYVHEVFSESDISKKGKATTVQVAAASSSGMNAEPHAGSNLYRKTLENIYAVNPKDVDLAIDSNWEPVVALSVVKESLTAEGGEAGGVDFSRSVEDEVLGYRDRLAAFLDVFERADDDEDVSALRVQAEALFGSPLLREVVSRGLLPLHGQRVLAEVLDGYFSGNNVIGDDSTERLEGVLGLLFRTIPDDGFLRLVSGALEGARWLGDIVRNPEVSLGTLTQILEDNPHIADAVWSVVKEDAGAGNSKEKLNSSGNSQGNLVSSGVAKSAKTEGNAGNAESPPISYSVSKSDLSYQSEGVSADENDSQVIGVERDVPRGTISAGLAESIALAAQERWSDEGEFERGDFARALGVDISVFGDWEGLAEGSLAADVWGNDRRLRVSKVATKGMVEPGKNELQNGAKSVHVKSGESFFRFLSLSLEYSENTSQGEIERAFLEGIFEVQADMVSGVSGGLDFSRSPEDSRSLVEENRRRLELLDMEARELAVALHLGKSARRDYGLWRPLWRTVETRAEYLERLGAYVEDLRESNREAFLGQRGEEAGLTAEEAGLMGNLGWAGLTRQQAESLAEHERRGRARAAAAEVGRTVDEEYELHESAKRRAIEDEAWDELLERARMRRRWAELSPGEAGLGFADAAEGILETLGVLLLAGEGKAADVVNAPVTVWFLKGNSSESSWLEAGDAVTLSLGAADAAAVRAGGGMSVFSQEVPVSALWWDGADMVDLEYHPVSVGERVNHAQMVKHSRLVDVLVGRTPGSLRPGVEKYQRADGTVGRRLRGAGSPVQFSRSAADADGGTEQAEAVRRQWKNPDGSYKPGWMKAPSGLPTKLNERQWLHVRTPAFKKWFGDWEGVWKKLFLEGDPVGEVSLDVAPEGGFNVLSRWAIDLFKKQGGRAVNPDIGEVVFDGQSVRSSLAHGGANKYKRAAFAVVKDVVEKGWLIHSREDKGRLSHYIAAPVKIGGRDNLVVVLAHQRSGDSRMYLHMVGTKESLLMNRVSGGALAGHSSSTSSRDIVGVLTGILSVNPDSVSKVVDENGEPKTNEQGTFAFGVHDSNRVKSATGNSGAYDVGSSDINFSRSAVDSGEELEGLRGAFPWLFRRYEVLERELEKERAAGGFSWGHEIDNPRELERQVRAEGDFIVLAHGVRPGEGRGVDGTAVPAMRELLDAFLDGLPSETLERLHEQFVGANKMVPAGGFREWFGRKLSRANAAWVPGLASPAAVESGLFENLGAQFREKLWQLWQGFEVTAVPGMAADALVPFLRAGALGPAALTREQLKGASGLPDWWEGPGDGLQFSYSDTRMGGLGFDWINAGNILIRLGQRIERKNLDASGLRESDLRNVDLFFEIWAGLSGYRNAFLMEDRFSGNQMWSVRSVNPDLYKGLLIKKLEELSEANGWNYGYGEDENALGRFKKVVYFDTPEGQVSFHIAEYPLIEAEALAFNALDEEYKALYSLLMDAQWGVEIALQARKFPPRHVSGGVYRTSDAEDKVVYEPTRAGAEKFGLGDLFAGREAFLEAKAELEKARDALKYFGVSMEDSKDRLLSLAAHYGVKVAKSWPKPKLFEALEAFHAQNETREKLKARVAELEAELAKANARNKEFFDAWHAAVKSELLSDAKVADSNAKIEAAKAEEAAAYAAIDAFLERNKVEMRRLNATVTDKTYTKRFLGSSLGREVPNPKPYRGRWDGQVGAVRERVRRLFNAPTIEQILAEEGITPPVKGSDSAEARVDFSRSGGQRVPTVAFEEGMRSYLEGSLATNRILSLGHVPRPLRVLGAEGEDTLFPQSVLNKARKKHGIPDALLAEFGRALDAPVMVFASGSSPGNKVVLTRLSVPDGRSIVMAVRLGVSHGSSSVVGVESVHPKENIGRILDWIEKGRALWYDPEMAKTFLGNTTPANQERAQKRLSSTAIAAGSAQDRIFSDSSQGGKLQFSRSGGDFDGGGLLGMIRRVLGGGPPRSRRVWHGSPHKFLKFSLSSIGMGEGNQSFGWGLYFAENQAVTGRYKPAGRLVPGERVFRVGRKYYSPGNFKSAEDEYIYEGLLRMAEVGVGRTYAEYNALGDDEKERSWAVIGFIEGLWEAKANGFGEVVEEKGEPGALYQVDLAVEDGELLDWDVPLSQQPKKVQQAVLAAFAASGRSGSGASAEWFLAEDSRVTGADIMGYLYDSHGDGEYNSPKAASMALLAGGIPGLRYLDGFSRKDGEGTHNYVIWDESRIRMVSANGVAIQRGQQEVNFSRSAEDALAKILEGRRARISERTFLSLSSYGGARKIKVRGMPVWWNVLAFFDSDGSIRKIEFSGDGANHPEHTLNGFWSVVRKADGGPGEFSFVSPEFESLSSEDESRFIRENGAETYERFKDVVRRIFGISAEAIKKADAEAWAVLKEMNPEVGRLLGQEREYDRRLRMKSELLEELRDVPRVTPERLLEIFNTHEFGKDSRIVDDMAWFSFVPEVIARFYLERDEVGSAEHYFRSFLNRADFSVETRMLALKNLEEEAFYEGAFDDVDVIDVESLVDDIEQVLGFEHITPAEREILTRLRGVAQAAFDRLVGEKLDEFISDYGYGRYYTHENVSGAPMALRYILDLNRDYGSYFRPYLGVDEIRELREHGRAIIFSDDSLYHGELDMSQSVWRDWHDYVVDSSDITDADERVFYELEPGLEEDEVADGELREEDDDAEHFPLASNWLLLVSESPEAFRYGKTESADAKDIAAAVSTPGSPITTSSSPHHVVFSSKNGSLTVMDADTSRPYISAGGAGSEGKKEGGGSQLYMAALDWIHNNGKMVKPDPSGISSINKRRRTSNLLSSALRWGTTKHLKPHSSQDVEWSYSFGSNLRSLLLREMELVQASASEAKGWRYNVGDGTFRDESGKVLTDEDFAKVAAKTGRQGIGETTLKRALITQSLFGKGKLEGGHSKLPSRVLYSRSEGEAGSRAGKLAQADKAASARMREERGGERLNVVYSPDEVPSLNAGRAKRWAVENLVGKALPNADTGREFYVSGKGLKKMLAGNKGFAVERVAALYNLAAMVGEAKGVEMADGGADPNIAKAFHLYVPFGWKGKVYRVRLLAREFADAKNPDIHSYRIEDVVLAEESAGLAELPRSRAEESADSRGQIYGIPSDTSPATLTVDELFSEDKQETEFDFSRSPSEPSSFEPPWRGKAALFERKVVDSAGDLRRFVKVVEDVTGKPVEDDPYTFLSWLRQSADSIVLQMVRTGMVDMAGNLTGVGPLAEVFKGLDEAGRRDFREWLSMMDDLRKGELFGDDVPRYRELTTPDFKLRAVRLAKWIEGLLAYAKETNTLRHWVEELEAEWGFKSRMAAQKAAEYTGIGEYESLFVVGDVPFFQFIHTAVPTRGEEIKPRLYGSELGIIHPKDVMRQQLFGFSKLFHLSRLFKPMISQYLREAALMGKSKKDIKLEVSSKDLLSRFFTVDSRLAQALIDDITHAAELFWDEGIYGHIESEAARRSWDFGNRNSIERWLPPKRLRHEVSMREAWEGLSDADELLFARYLHAKRTLALQSDPKHGPRMAGMDVVEAEAVIAEVEGDAARGGDFARRAQMVWDWNEQLLFWLRFSDPKLSAAAKRIVKADPGSYIPLHRVEEDETQAYPRIPNPEQILYGLPKGGAVASEQKRSFTIDELVNELASLLELHREGSDKHGNPLARWGFMQELDWSEVDEAAGATPAADEKAGADDGKIPAEPAKKKQPKTFEEQLVLGARTFVRRAQHAAVMDRVIRMARDAEAVTGPLIQRVENPDGAKSALSKGYGAALHMVGSRKEDPTKPSSEENPRRRGGAAVDNGLAAFFAGDLRSADGRTIYVPQLESVGGDVVWYAVPAELSDAVASMSRKVGKFSESWTAEGIKGWSKEGSKLQRYTNKALGGADIFVSVLQTMARMFRAGATALNPRFGLVTNVLRDFRTLTVNTRTGTKPLKVWKNWVGFMVYGFLRAVSGQDLRGLGLSNFADIYEAFDRLGMRLSGSLTQDSEPLKAALRDVRRGGEWRALPHVSDLWEFMLGVLQFPESAARMAEMKTLAEQNGWSPAQKMTPAIAAKLAHAGKSVTVDFTRAGAYAQRWNTIVPFFNSSIQGKVSSYEAFKRNPVGWLLTRALPIVILTALNWWRNKDEDWYREMEDTERTAYDYIRLGNGEVLRIPRSFEVDMLFAALTEALLDAAYKSEPDRLGSWFETAFEQFSSVLSTDSSTLFVNQDSVPPLVREVWAQFKNYDAFYKKPIVSKSREESAVPDQYSPYTTNLSITLGKMFGASPLRLDHALKGTTAGVGDWVAGLGGRGSDISLPPREKEPSDALLGLGAGVFRRGGDEPLSGRTVRTLYNRAAQLSEQADENPDRSTRSLLTGAWAALHAIQALQYRHSRTPSREERKDLSKQQLEIAREALDALDDGEISKKQHEYWRFIENQNLPKIP